LLILQLIWKYIDVLAYIKGIFLMIINSWI